MKGLVFLTGEAPEIAEAELEGALIAMGGETRIADVSGQAAVLDGIPPPGLARRLGFSHFSGEMDEVGGTSIEEITESVSSLIGEIDRELSVSWTVKTPGTNTELRSKDIFDAVDKELRSAGLRIRHRNPDIRFFIIIAGGQGYVGRILETSSRSSAEKRRGSRMPFNRPVIMDPRLARVLVNLSGLPPGRTVLDPFMGPAGLAVECADLGLNVIGVEKNPIIFEGARDNIEHLGMSGMISARNGDSKKLRSYPWAEGMDRIDGIITDPPFGRSASTHGDGTGELLADVLDEVSELVRRGGPLVVDAPDPGHFREIEGYSLKKELSLRIHRSMTRHIGVLARI